MKESAYVKRKALTRFRRRAVIEPRIDRIKSDFRLGRNFLKRQNGESINLLRAATVSKLSPWMRRALAALFYWLRFLLSKTIPLPALRLRGVAKGLLKYSREVTFNSQLHTLTH